MPSLGVDDSGVSATLTTNSQSETRTDKARILVVDDEESIIDVLRTTLRFVGFEVESAMTGHEAVTKATQFIPDVILLDVMLPDTDGFELYKRIQQSGRDVPVLFVTAKDAVEDRVGGLRLGADDYITKPFSLEEVVARVNAVLRRVRPEADTAALQYEDLELNEDTHRVHRNGELIDLSPTEFRLLHYLMLNSEKVLSKSQILDYVWQYDFGGDGNVVETYISYLRKKIDKIDPPLIHTVRMVGYVLRKESK